MYLDNTGILGLTANGANILTLDGSIPSTPQITTVASVNTTKTITATGGVLGGTF